MVTFKTATIGYQVAKPHYEGFRKGGAHEGEEGRDYFREPVRTYARTLDYKSHSSRKESVEQYRERKDLHMEDAKEVLWR